jgi:CheY-like chemotaxis protein
MTDSHLPASKRTILVVDDEQEIVAVVRTRLEQNGYNVRCAYSGLHVFAALAAQKPDLILLDIMMPQMDGLEVLTRLRENSDTASIPVIFLTAMVHDEDLRRGYKMGAKYYITKPFTSTQVLEGINLILDGDQGRSVGNL